MEQTELIQRAKAGDRDAFAELYKEVERPLAAFLCRMVAVRQDAEDLAQDTALRALETIRGFAGASSFRAWIFRLAAQAAMQHLKSQGRWDPDALIRAGEAASADASVRRRFQKLHRSGLHTTYTIAEHIDFCLTCMGRALPPHEAAAFFLAELHGFSPEEAAEVLEVPPHLVRSRIDEARRAVAGHLDSRCSLTNKAGICTQCADIHTLVHGDRRGTERALFEIQLEPRPTAAERAATLDQRLAIVRSIDPLHAEGTKFHESWMTFTREVSGY